MYTNTNQTNSSVPAIENLWHLNDENASLFTKQDDKTGRKYSCYYPVMV